MDKKAIVIYHANCMDGFGAAWAFHVLKEPEYGAENVTYIPRSYGEIPDWNLLEKHDHCYIVDFSFKKDVLTQISYLFEKTVLLDHHKTALEDLKEFIDDPRTCPRNLEIVFDMARSGAGITWDYFAPSGSKRNELINYIEDRDIWKFVQLASKEINAVTAATEKTFEAYSTLAEKLEVTWGDVRDIGEYLLSQHNQIVQSILPNARQCNIGEHIGLIVNCTPQFASDVGNELAKISGTFGGSYYSDAKGKVRVSLRSIGDFDVSKLAKSFGGGGHRNAAGFELTPQGTSENVAIWSLDSMSI